MCRKVFVLFQTYKVMTSIELCVFALTSWEVFELYYALINIIF